MKKFENTSLKEYNTFHVDANTNTLCICESIDDLKSAVNQSKRKNENILILGGGSNVLFVNDFDGTVIIPDLKGMELIEETETQVLVKAGAGEVWDDLVKFSIKNKLWGIENLSLIPGSVGAAPIQNIGAYGVELVDVFISLTAMDIETLEMKTYNKEDCNFSYRNSIFKKDLKNKSIITDVTLKLSKQGKPNLGYGAFKEKFEGREVDEINIAEISDAVREIRMSKLPDVGKIGNGGSFFKNPEIDIDTLIRLKNEFPDIVYFELPDNKYKIAAGWMIDRCGLKGYRMGDVGTFPKQALVIVNYGNATGVEILEFAKIIKKKVYDKFQIELQPEVNIIN